MPDERIVGFLALFAWVVFVYALYQNNKNDAAEARVIEERVTELENILGVRK